MSSTNEYYIVSAFKTVSNSITPWFGTESAAERGLNVKALPDTQCALALCCACSEDTTVQISLYLLSSKSSLPSQSLKRPHYSLPSHLQLDTVSPAERSRIRGTSRARRIVSAQAVQTLLFRISRVDQTDAADLPPSGGKMSQRKDL